MARDEPGAHDPALAVRGAQLDEGVGVRRGLRCVGDGSLVCSPGGGGGGVAAVLAARAMLYAMFRFCLLVGCLAPSEIEHWQR